MGRKHKNKKRKQAAVARQAQPSHPNNPKKDSTGTEQIDDIDEDIIHGISPEELLITVDTLQALSDFCSRKSSSTESGNKPAAADSAAAGEGGESFSSSNSPPDLLTILSQKRYKALRTALHPFVSALFTKYDPHANITTYQARVTSSLQAGGWTDAFTFLKCLLELEVGETASIKRGTVQRWVRLCDDCPHPNLKLKILRSVLACSPQDEVDAEADASKDGTDQQLNKHDPRRAIKECEEQQQQQLGRKRKATDHDAESDCEEKVDDGADEEMKIVKSTIWTIPESEVTPEAAAAGTSNNAEKSPIGLNSVDVEIVHHVPADERKPSNHYDLTIYATPPNTIQIQPPTVQTKRHDVDLIPGEYGTFVMTNVLSASECAQILAIAENKMKYIPDHPTSLKDPTGIDTCEWLVDDSILGPIHERILPLVNETVHGEKIAGVNARWRLFRYGKERTYRPHIDGSWPGSGRCSKTGEYTSDAFDGDRRSRYTFLIYLNDGFEGGGTTFYLPSKNECDGFDTVAVKPSRGSVLCFPQGNTASLLHEGSRVTGGGARKYVVRTDLLYHVKKGR